MGSGIQAQLLDQVRNYRMPVAAQELLRGHPPLILTGPTASGKNAIASYLEKVGGYRRIVTHTTRPLRPGEVHGQHYHFVSPEEMLRLIQSQAMIEVKLIHEETIYGVSIEAYQSLVNSNIKPVLTIDVQGAEEILRKVPSLQPIFIVPPDLETWMERWHLRGSMSHQERQRRFRSAQKELELAYRSEHYNLVVNHEVAETAREIARGMTDHSSRQQKKELINHLLDAIRTY